MAIRGRGQRMRWARWSSTPGCQAIREILSDPSYSGQLVTMTYPEIGNTGINDADMESSPVVCQRVYLHEMNRQSNWRSQGLALKKCLRRNGHPGHCRIDTRALTSKLREGTLKGLFWWCPAKSMATGCSACGGVGRLEWAGLCGQG